MVVLWAMYLLGQFVSLIMRADQVSASKYTPWDSVAAYVKAHGAQIIYSFFTSTMIFLLWWRAPDTLSTWGLNVSKYFPLTMATAGIYGIISDKVTAYLLSKLKFMDVKGSGDSL